MLDHSAWNSLVLAHGPASGSFLHSWEWGEFQRDAGAEVLRVELEENDGRALAQAIIRPLPAGLTLAYLPRGPILDKPDKELAEKIIAKLAQECKKKKAVALRVDPALELSVKNSRLAAPTQPQTTLLLNLTKLENELLAEMHEKTRYNIRLAERKGVSVRQGGAEFFPELWQLIEQTAGRDRFRLHPKKYYETMMRMIGSNQDSNKFSIKILLADYQNKTIAGMILAFFGQQAIYLHGGSADEHKNVMAPHLLQWRAMQLAKQLGCESYDLWGVAPEGAVNHPLAGVSRFKRGFGGELWHAPDSLELPLRTVWYTIYALAKRLQK